jgi:uncharacterized membrane protein (DUF485 family)
MTFDKLKEKYLSVFMAVVIAFVNLKINFSSKIDMNSFMEKSIDISSISFGFLLAVLALLLQSDTSAITRIKANGRFGELINFNRKAVIASAILAIVGLLYITTKISTCYANVLIFNQFKLGHLSDCIVLAIFIFQLIEVYLFLDLFYFVIK